MTAMTAHLYQTARTSDTTCTMRLSSGEVIYYWMPANGGYVRETTYNRPGTLGQQVSDDLAGSGDMMYLPAGADLTSAIRRAARTVAGRANLQCRVDCHI